MQEAGANEELFSLIVVGKIYIFILFQRFFCIGFINGLGRQDAERMCILIHQALRNGFNKQKKQRKSNKSSHIDHY